MPNAGYGGWRRRGKASDASAWCNGGRNTPLSFSSSYPPLPSPPPPCCCPRRCPCRCPPSPRCLRLRPAKPTRRAHDNDVNASTVLLLPRRHLPRCRRRRRRRHSRRRPSLTSWGTTTRLRCRFSIRNGTTQGAMRWSRNSRGTPRRGMPRRA